MCGFLGEVTSRPRDSLDWSTEAVLRALRHRGPDGEGVFEDEGASPRCRMVHTRLAIIDPRRVAAQPMSDGERGLTLVFNGEIYNYRDLRGELAARGEAFSTDSDTEVLLKAYAVWGPACVERLRGMFAFGVWDARARRLTLARDRLGIKPLYLAERSGPESGLRFASEVRALLAAGVAPRLSEEALSSFLAFGAVWSRQAIVRGIEELEPGTLLVCENGKASRQRYWRPHPSSNPRPATAAAAVAVVSPLLREAVALQLRSDVPLGIFLSAGMDSAALAALASEALGSPPVTLTVNFAGPEAEGREARSVARALGTDHRQVDVSLEQAAAWVPEAVASMDQPSVDGVNSWIVSRAAREAGLKVCLSGLGGDELFAGYSTFKQFGAMLRMGRLLGVMGRPVSALLARAPFSRSRFDVRLRKATALLAAGGGGAVDSYAVLRSLFAPEQAAMLWPGLDHHGVRRRDVRLEGESPNDPVNELSYLELSNYMRGTLLRDADAMSMSHGLEVRPPLLDERLTEVLLGVPGQLKIARGINKPVLWGCVEKLLPPALPRRRKTGFGLPFDAWLDGPLRGWHREGLEAARDLGLSAEGERQLAAARAHGALAWHRWFAPAVLGHWAATNGARS